jgi:hypothetical protein
MTAHMELSQAKSKTCLKIPFSRVSSLLRIVVSPLTGQPWCQAEGLSRLP